MTDDQYVELLRAIREHSGLELNAIRDAGTHGADGGFAGFTYTTDGADFYRANRNTIDEMLQEHAEAFDLNVAQFVAQFSRADMCDTDDGRACLLAWYALEAVGRRLADRQYERTGA